MNDDDERFPADFVNKLSVRPRSMLPGLVR